MTGGESSPTTRGPPSQSSSKASAVAMSSLASFDYTTFSYMLMNFLSSTFLVVVNKIVMDKFHFRFATTLTCIHLLCTFLLLLITARLGLFHIKELPLKSVSKLALGTMGFICLTNLSLQHNSVGFYQVMKVMTTPTVVIIEALLYQKYLDNQLKVALVPVCLGVIITTATDFRLNLVGASYAVAGVIVTSFYQIWSGTLQESLNCNALQLQTYVSPLAAVFILPFVFIFDNYMPTNVDSIWFYQFNRTTLGLIAVTGFFGFLVNISIFLVIGRSSPVSYNVLGHCKTAVVLISDFVLFGRPVDLKSSTGILFTLVGVVWYTSLKLENSYRERANRSRHSDAKQSELLSVKSVSSSDEEEVLLESSK